MLLLQQWQQVEPSITSANTIWSNLWCSNCLKADPCPNITCGHHDQLLHIKDRTQPLTHATLPDQFYIAKAHPDQQNEAVFARVPLTPNVVLGPLQAPQSKLPKHCSQGDVTMQWLNRHWLIFNSNEVPSLLTCEDENKCNWLSLIRPYRSQEAHAKIKPNLMVFQYKDEIYFITTRHIKVYEELQYDYSPGYSTLLLLFLKNSAERSEEAWTERYSVEQAFKTFLVQQSPQLPSSSEQNPQLEPSQNDSIADSALATSTEIEESESELLGGKDVDMDVERAKDENELSAIEKLVAEGEKRLQGVGKEEGGVEIGQGDSGKYSLAQNIIEKTLVDSATQTDVKRGWKRKSFGQEEKIIPTKIGKKGKRKTDSSMKKLISSYISVGKVVVGQKRGRGRPRKYPRPEDIKQEVVKAEIETEQDEIEDKVVDTHDNEEDCDSDKTDEYHCSNAVEEQEVNKKNVMKEEPLEEEEDRDLDVLQQEEVVSFEEALNQSGFDDSKDNAELNATSLSFSEKDTSLESPVKNSGTRRKGRPRKHPKPEPVDEEFGFDHEEGKTEEEIMKSKEKKLHKMIESVAERTIRLSVLICTEENPATTVNMDSIQKVEVRLWYIQQDMLEYDGQTYHLTVQGSRLDVTDRITPLQHITPIHDGKTCLIMLNYPERWGPFIDTVIINQMLSQLQTSDNAMGVCNMCGWMSQKPNNVKFHLIRTHTAIRDYLCDFCGAKFRDWRELGRHKLKHVPAENQQKFYCPTCKKPFNRKDKLKRHMRIHDKSHLTQMCDYCGKPFRCKDHLRRHVDTVHLNIRQFSCPICSRSYKEKRDMKRHMSSVHSINPDTSMVQQEDGTFALTADVNELVTVQARIPCPICSTTFIDHRDLKRHISKKHSAEEQEAFAEVNFTSPGKSTTVYADSSHLQTNPIQIQSESQEHTTTTEEMSVGPAPAAAAPQAQGGLLQCQTIQVGPSGVITLPYSGDYQVMDVQQLAALGYGVTNVQ